MMFRTCRKNIAKICIRIADRYKFLLLEVFPRRWLRKVKNAILHDTVLRGSGMRLMYEKGEFPQGINLIGHIRSELGLGQGCRLMAKAIECTEIPFLALNFDTVVTANNLDTEWEHKLTKKAVYNTNIIHVNPGQMDVLHMMLPTDTWNKRYNIAIWLWEFEEFPEKWCKYFELVDEVWTPSSFVTKAISSKAPMPVITVPYGIYADTDLSMDRQYFGLPEDAFLFLCMYDVNSNRLRKNPNAAIEAFKKAFLPESKEVGLVVKINNINDIEKNILLKAVAGYGNIYIIGYNMRKTEVNSLIKSCNVFVSLHKSEGFGLVMAEAMYLGRPSVATGWSANLDFMTENNSCLVGYELEYLDKESYYPDLYEPGQRWALPDIEQAAGYMIRLYEDVTFYNEKALQGEAEIKEHFSIQKSSEKIFARLKELELI